MYRSQIDVEKCIIRLFDKEAKVTARQNALAKRTAKLRNCFDIRRREFEMQNAKLEKRGKNIAKLQTDIKTLKQFRDEMHSRLLIKRTIAEQIKTEVTQRTAALAAKRKEHLEAQCNLRVLKEATNIHINCHVLPEVVQGVVLCENGPNTIWRPFKYNSRQYKQQELQHQIWAHSNIANEYQQQWLGLIFGEKPNET